MMKVTILCGGVSAERDVSLASGNAVNQALLSQGFQTQLLDTGSLFIEDLRVFHPDVVFIALHGRMGEDGTIQGLLEVLGYPYVGSGILTSAIAIDKRTTKRILLTEHLPLAKDYVLKRTDPAPDRALAQQLGETIGFPYIIKPNREGSTIGLSLAHTAEEAVKGMNEALQYDDEVLIEEYIEGTEVTAVVIGDAYAPDVLGVIEIIPKAVLYDYESKYSQGGSEHIIPARIGQDRLQEVENYAKSAYRTLGCTDYARVDFIVSKTGPIILEVNTLPGMTATSLVPDAAKARGISFEDFLVQMVNRCYARNKKK